MPILETYLNDHLAGSTGALQLLAHLIEEAPDLAFADFCRALRDEVQADVEQLRELMKRLDHSESAVKKTGAWLAEKVTEIKLLLEGEYGSDFGRFEALEVLSLGILGKKALWTALQTVQDSTPALSEFDLPLLIRRADEQYERTEVERLAAAQRALRC